MSEARKTKFTIEPGKQELWVAREFNAARRLVFKAHSDPKYYVLWYGCRGMHISVEQFDGRPGGSYRYLQTFDGPETYVIRGSFHELREDRIVRTSEFSGRPDRVVLEIVTLESLPGDRTRLNTQMIFQSVADRDAMVEAGVEKGTNQAHELLDQLLQQMR